MKDIAAPPQTQTESHGQQIAAVTVPVREVTDHRRNYPASRISFHLELTCTRLEGLSAFCRCLEATGLGMVSLKAEANGTIYCVLLDDRHVDLSHLARDLNEVAILDRWTTQIEL